MYEYVRFMQYPAAKVSSGDPVRKAPALTFELCGVSFKYHGSDAYALRDLSLRIPAGQKLAVVGPNGAGKTTLVKLLTRLYDPSEGEILLDGQDIRRFAPEDYAKLFAVVFQDYSLLAFSIRDNVALGKDGNDAAVRSVLRLAGLEEKVAGLARGIDTPVYKVFDDDGLELSGGESQKLAIARAIYRDAPVVTLDEPTAALDPVAEYEVYRRFDAGRGQDGIYISHRLSSCASATASRWDGGAWSKYGPTRNFRRGGRYLKMWDAQAQCMPARGFSSGHRSKWLGMGIASAQAALRPLNSPDLSGIDLLTAATTKHCVLVSSGWVHRGDHDRLDVFIHENVDSSSLRPRWENRRHRISVRAMMAGMNDRVEPDSAPHSPEPGAGRVVARRFTAWPAAGATSCRKPPSGYGLGPGRAQRNRRRGSAQIAHTPFGSLISHSYWQPWRSVCRVYGWRLP